MPVVYDELRRLAEVQLRRERANNTLQPTALVHETYIRLTAQRSLVSCNAKEILTAAVTVMRRILVDYARARATLKRSVKLQRTLLDDVIDCVTDNRPKA